ncbi:MAG: radical SAM protein [Acidobacteriota bacterium]
MAVKQVELSALHDFAGKLCQPSVIDHLKEYVLWQAARRRGEATAPLPARAPLSINLDLTTACNFLCDHCVDLEILNTGISFDHARLKDALALMAGRGLRSVIVIGGGEPTVYPGFGDIVGLLKDLGLQVGVVTNGSRLEKVTEVAGRLDERDWVRLSLDSASDELFQAMHKPRKPVTLDEICAKVRALKAANPKPRVGFSFIIVWKDCEAHDTAIHENVHEIVLAARRAKEYGFDYISYKPFLTRAASNNAEMVGLAREEDRLPAVMAGIREQLDRARELAGDGFAVVESTNLRVFENGSYRDFSRQPRQCHMQPFRQVLSPLGVFNCPVYRNVDAARIGGRHAYATPEGFDEAVRSTAGLVEGFDASAECREVTCLYNHANWFIEELIEDPSRLDALETAPERGDYYL